MKDKSEIFKSVNINLDLDNRIESKTMNDLSEIHKNEVIHHDRTLEKILSIQYSNQEKNDSIKKTSIIVIIIIRCSLKM